MSKTPEDFFEWEASAVRMPRVSYTLNNDQPVRCTIIGDQPLFYMDYESDLEDDFDDLFEIDMIEKSLMSLQEKVTTCGTAYKDHFLSEQEKGLLFSASAAAVTSPPSPDWQIESDLSTLRSIMEKSRMAKAFLDFAAEESIIIIAGVQVDTAFYDRQASTIFVNGSLDIADQVLLTVRELRRAWQHRHGALLHALTFHPDQAILVNRAQIADLHVMMVRVAWELQLAGENLPWQRIETSSLSDLGRAFAREAHMDFRTLNNGEASSAVFESWFLSDRCSHEDRNLIQNMLSDYRGYVFDNSEASRQVTAGLILALGSAPYGKNYLAPYVHLILEDALFTEVRDRSNANFLWFIKFERSFTEAERELQKTEIVHSHELSHDDPHNKKEWIGDDEKEQTVIALPGIKSTARICEGAPAETSATIIPFRRRGSEG
ncbi:MAG: hypothetical protein H6868_01955 [Rhodospirillales bacterium]|nr:hypothetical protein [Rhodospirillales bacterium]